MKEETKCYCGHTTTCDCGPEESINYRQTGASEFVAKTIIKDTIIQKEEPKQETIKKKNMSTTFGIPQRQVELNILVNEFGDLHDYIDTSFFEKVFFRSSKNSRWMNSLANRLPDNTLVFPLDNTAQGIYTIGDLKKFLKEKENETDSQV